MKFLCFSALTMVASTALASPAAPSAEQVALATERLGSSEISFGVPLVAAATNPYTAVYGATFFADTSTHYTRRLSLRDPSSGQFAVRCDNVPAGVIAYQPDDGGMVYSVSPNPNIVTPSTQLWKIDPLTCAYTSLQANVPFDTTVFGASFSPDGRLWFAGTGKLYQVNTVTGAVINTIAIGAISSGGAGGIAFGAGGDFYAAQGSRLMRWPQVPSSSPAPGPVSDVDLAAIAPPGRTLGDIAALTYITGGSMLAVTSQLDQAGQSTFYAGYEYTTASGTLVNSSTLFPPANGVFSMSSYPRAANLVLSLTLQGSGEIAPASPLTWASTLRNDGPQTAVNAAVTYNLPPHLAFIPATTDGSDSSRSCTGDTTYGSQVICTTTLGVGQVNTFTLATQLDPAMANGRETVYAEVTKAPFSQTSVAGNNSGKPGSGIAHEPDDATVSYVVGPSAHLDASIEGTPYAIWPGDTVTYTVTVHNAGPSPATGVTLVDNLPGGLSPTSVTGSGWTCSIPGQRYECALVGTLGVNQSAQVTLVATGATPGSYTNSCTVASNLLDPAPSQNCSTQTVVRTQPGSAPPIAGANNPQSSCPEQFTGMLAFKEVLYPLNTSSPIGGAAYLEYPTDVMVDGGEVACYGAWGDESSKIPQAACSIDQPVQDSPGVLRTNCTISTSGPTAYCAWRAYVRTSMPGNFPLHFHVELIGSPNTSNDVTLPMIVVDEPDYIFMSDFESRQRPDEPTQNCQL
ncbi:MAG: DUF11 domain-containing protein [Burkholderiales bacterium]|nr:DUF11 domain-containing protein [Burkholderiales bacterium]